MVEHNRAEEPARRQTVLQKRLQEEITQLEHANSFINSASVAKVDRNSSSVSVVVPTGADHGPSPQLKSMRARQRATDLWLDVLKPKLLDVTKQIQVWGPLHDIYPDPVSTGSRFKEAALPHLILNPHGSFRLYWDLTQILALLYVAIVVPFVLCFDPVTDPDSPRQAAPHESSWDHIFSPVWWLAFSVDVYFVCDIFVNLRTAQELPNGMLLMEASDIKREYMKRPPLTSLRWPALGGSVCLAASLCSYYADSPVVENWAVVVLTLAGLFTMLNLLLLCMNIGWFWIDFVSCLPIVFRPIYLAMHYGWFSGGSSNGSGSPSSNSFVGINMMKLMRLVRLSKLLRMAKIKRMIDTYKDTILLVMPVLGTLALILGIMIVAHWLACIWYIVGTIDYGCDITSPADNGPMGCIKGWANSYEAGFVFGRLESYSTREYILLKYLVSLHSAFSGEHVFTIYEYGVDLVSQLLKVSKSCVRVQESTCKLFILFISFFFSFSCLVVWLVSSVSLIDALIYICAIWIASRSIIRGL